jgi:RNA polymerase sigma-70 factor, ECF subfamily
VVGSDAQGGSDRPESPTRSPAAGRPQRPSCDPVDEELIRGVAAGSESALAGLYDRWGKQAYSLARRICADEGMAEDVVQEAFVAVWRDPGRFDPARGGFGTWLLTVVHHKAVDAVRRESAVRRRGERFEDDPTAATVTGPGADQGALEAVAAGQVRDALAQLSCPQRQALALTYYGGYTQREVAAMTGVALGTVKSRMFSGIQRLRALLGPSLDDPAADDARDSRGPR